MTLTKENTKQDIKKMNKQAMTALISLTVLVYIGIFIVGGDMARTIYSVAAGITALFLIIILYFVKDFQ